MNSDYKKLREIGKGGMATVYLARDLENHRLVAIKVLNDIILHDDEYIKRFFREARITAQLDHPNIIKIIESNYSRGECYIVTEYISGGDFRSLLADLRVSMRQKLAVVAKVLDALDFAHSEGIVHRDIKPSNILLTRELEPKLCDFGIATALWGHESRLTRTNEMMGTMDYIAPEQKENSRNVDFRADLYSIGVILYQVVTGRKPMGAFPPPIEITPTIPVELDACIMKCLQPHPIKRFKSTRNLCNQLEDVLRYHMGGNIYREPTERLAPPAPSAEQSQQPTILSGTGRPVVGSDSVPTITHANRHRVSDGVSTASTLPPGPRTVTIHNTNTTTLTSTATGTYSGTPQTVAQMIDILRLGSLPEKLICKAQFLQIIAPEHEEKLMEMLKEEEGFLLETVIEALGKIKSSNSCSYLIELLNNPYYNKHAAAAIGEIGCKEAEYKLFNLLVSDSANSYIALVPLGKLNSVKSVKAIAGFLKNQHVWIREMALDALGMIDGDNTAIHDYFAVTSRQDENAHIRAKAKKLLWRLKK